MTSTDGHVDELLSGYIDGELTQQDSQRVALHCETCAECQAELAALSALRERVAAAPLAPLGEQVWAEHMTTTLGLGWMLFVVGVVGVTAWGVYEFVLDAAIDSFYKVLVGVLYLGLAVLFVGVLRQRLSERKTDKYKDVEI